MAEKTQPGGVEARAQTEQRWYRQTAKRRAVRIDGAGHPPEQWQRYDRSPLCLRLSTPGCLSPGLSAYATSGTTRQLNTHNIESRDVHYPWHPWYGRRVWVYRISLGRVQPVARCGLEPTQCAKSLEVPLWTLEASFCSTLRPAEAPRVDCAALQTLRALLHRSVLQDRHPFAGGADADPHESTPGYATGTVSSSIRRDPMAQATARNPTESGDVARKAASRILGNPASSRQGEGGQP